MFFSIQIIIIILIGLEHSLVERWMWPDAQPYSVAMTSTECGVGRQEGNREKILRDGGAAACVWPTRGP